MQELLAADRKIWNLISELYSQNWRLDDALYELTSVRGDLSSLLQPRPRVQKPAAPFKGHGAKGKGNQGRKRTADWGTQHSPFKRPLSCLSGWLQSSGRQKHRSTKLVNHNSNAWLGRCSSAAGGRAEPGQPLRLNLLRALAMKINDKDSALIPMLKAGVTTGVHEPIPSSLQWPKKVFGNAGRELVGGGGQAFHSSVPHRSGWVQHIPGGRSAAQARWPSVTAVSKLNLVEGLAKTLALSYSTVCQVKPNCCFSSQPSDPHSMWMRASLDFKAAYKQVKVREQGQGMLLFEFAGQPLRSPLLSLLVATPGSPAATHCTSAPCATAPQSMALR